MESDVICVSEEEISAHLDGDLDRKRSDKVTTHLASCSSCQNLALQLDELRSELKNFSQAKLEHYLWPNIRRKYNTWYNRQTLGYRRRFWWTLPTAALSGAVVTLFVVWIIWPTKSSFDEKPSRPVSALTAVLEAEYTYQRTIASLEAALEDAKSSFDPAVQKAIEKGLADIEQTIERCRVLARRDPKNIETHKAVLAAYQYKVDFLRELVERTL